MDTIRDYAGLLKAIDARRREMGIPHLELDELAELPAGYTGKLFSRADKRNARVLGRESLGKILRALGLNLVPVRAAAAYKLAALAPLAVEASAVSARMKKIGRLGAIRTNAKLTPLQRSRNARKAIRCRWAKWRAEKRKAEALKARQKQQETQP